MNAAGLTSAVEGLGAKPSIKDRIAAHSAGPTPFLRKAVPPIRSLTMHLPAGLSWMPACGTGGEWRSRLRREAQAHFRSEPTVLHRCMDASRGRPCYPNTFVMGGGVWVNAAGLTSAADSLGGTASGCQTLNRARSGPCPPSSEVLDAEGRTLIACGAAEAMMK